VSISGVPVHKTERAQLSSNLIDCDMLSLCYIHYVAKALQIKISCNRSYKILYRHDSTKEQTQT
jgi:hypothetical protein